MLATALNTFKAKKRVTLYSLLLLAMILVYQIYHHGGKLLSKNQQERKDDWTKHLQSNHVKLSRTKAAIESPQPIRRDLKKTAEQGNPILQMEVKRLKTRINRKDSLIEKLTAQLEKEKSRAEKLNQVIGNLKVENTQLQAEVESNSNGVTSGRSEQNTGLKKELGSLIKTSPKISDIHISQRIPFESFAKTHLFEYSPKKKPKEYIFHGQNSNTRRVKSGERHLVQAQDIGVNFINTNTSYHVSRENMVDGVYRIDINTGIDYELYFKDPSANKFITVRLIRPLGVLQPVALPEDNRGPNELINLIVPLSGRLERFQQFMDMFVEVCIKIDKNVFLTVVLYGASDFNTVKTTLKDLEVTYGFKKYQLIMRDKPFSRGRALHDGVMYWSSSPKNVLMFFCDVDITIRPDFLRRCRMYTQRKEKIYYPMVFSLFNPKNVYEQGTIPPPAEQLKIDRKYGFWREYGFGMTCQYRADYLRVGGFDLNIEGWGTEDLGLYQRYLQQANIRIIRAPDRDLFHQYHDKKCDPSLSEEQYRSCLGSKAKVEGTHTQIAIQLTKLREKYEPESQSENGY